MKPKTLTTVAMVAALLVSSIFFLRSCAADGRLQEMKLQYETYRAINTAAHEMMSTRLDKLNSEVAAKDQIIGQLEQKIDTYVKKTALLTAELEELQNAEPVQPELESEPLVINLRAQVGKLTDMFSLATNTITLQNEKIDVLKGKVKLWEEVAGEWKGAFERERELRLQAEGLFKACERSQRMNKFWRTTSLVATGAVAGLLLLK